MTYISGKIRSIAAGLCTVALTACGSVYSYQSGGEATAQSAAVTSPARAGSGVRSLGQSVVGLFRPADPIPRPEQLLTPQVLAQVQDPLLLVFFETDGSFKSDGPWSTLIEAGRNGDVTTWVESTARTMSFTQTGLVAGTRGFGRDLMTVRADTMRRVLLGGAGSVTGAVRVHRTLDGENQILPHVFVCDINRMGSERIELLTGSYDTRRLEETCSDAEGRLIENEYWVDETGLIRQSLQWVSPELGRIKAQRLR